MSTYATWEDTLEAIRPLLGRHGFSLSFRPGRSAGGRPTVTGVLRHVGGHKEEGELELPPDETGGKNAVQAIGSALSYGQRYVTRPMLGLASRGDDDAQSAARSQTAVDTVAEINAVRDKCGLADWKRRNRQRLAELAQSDLRYVIGCYTERLRRLTSCDPEAAS